MFNIIIYGCNIHTTTLISHTTLLPNARKIDRHVDVIDRKKERDREMEMERSI